MSEHTRLSLDLADDFMMNEGINITKSDAFAGALKETKPDKVAQLCANDWIDAIHTKPTQMIRQISIRSRTSDYQMDESSESVHTSSNSLSIPYRLRLNIVREYEIAVFSK